jgi:hypothetical protein
MSVANSTDPKKSGQVESNGMDIFEAREGSTMQKTPMLRDGVNFAGFSPAIQTWDLYL